MKILKQIELERVTADLSRKQLEIIKSEEIESTKARIDAEFVRVGNDYKFVVKNIGKATAKNIKIAFEGDGYPFVADDFGRKTPISELRPGKEVEFLTARTMDCAHEYEISLRWFNPDGRQVSDVVLATW